MPYESNILPISSITQGESLRSFEAIQHQPEHQQAEVDQAIQSLLEMVDGTGSPERNPLVMAFFQDVKSLAKDIKETRRVLTSLGESSVEKFHKLVDIIREMSAVSQDLQSILNVVDTYTAVGTTHGSRILSGETNGAGQVAAHLLRPLLAETKETVSMARSLVSDLLRVDPYLRQSRETVEEDLTANRNTITESAKRMLSKFDETSVMYMLLTMLAAALAIGGRDNPSVAKVQQLLLSQITTQINAGSGELVHLYEASPARFAQDTLAEYLADIVSAATRYGSLASIQEMIEEARASLNLAVSSTVGENLGLASLHFLEMDEFDQLVPPGTQFFELIKGQFKSMAPASITGRMTDQRLMHMFRVVDQQLLETIAQQVGGTLTADLLLSVGNDTFVPLSAGPTGSDDSQSEVVFGKVVNQESTDSSPTPVPSQEERNYRPGETLIISSRTSLREYASAGSDVVATVPAGSAVEFIRMSTNGSYLLVIYVDGNGREHQGWVEQSKVQSVAPVEVASAGSLEEGSVARITGRTVLVKTLAENSPIVAGLGVDFEVTIIRGPVRGHYSVSYNRNGETVTGWVDAEKIEAVTPTEEPATEEILSFPLEATLNNDAPIMTNSDLTGSRKGWTLEGSQVTVLSVTGDVAHIETSSGTKGYIDLSKLDLPERTGVENSQTQLPEAMSFPEFALTTQEQNELQPYLDENNVDEIAVNFTVRTENGELVFFDSNGNEINNPASANSDLDDELQQLASLLEGITQPQDLVITLRRAENGQIMATAFLSITRSFTTETNVRFSEGSLIGVNGTETPHFLTREGNGSVVALNLNNPQRRENIANIPAIKATITLPESGIIFAQIEVLEDGKIVISAVITENSRVAIPTEEVVARSNAIRVEGGETISTDTIAFATPAPDQEAAPSGYSAVDVVLTSGQVRRTNVRNADIETRPVDGIALDEIFPKPAGAENAEEARAASAAFDELQAAYPDLDLTLNFDDRGAYFVVGFDAEGKSITFAEEGDGAFVLTAEGEAVVNPVVEAENPNEAGSSSENVTAMTLTVNAPIFDAAGTFVSFQDVEITVNPEQRMYGENGEPIPFGILENYQPDETVQYWIDNTTYDGQHPQVIAVSGIFYPGQKGDSYVIAIPSSTNPSGWQNVIARSDGTFYAGEIDGSLRVTTDRNTTFDRSTQIGQVLRLHDGHTIEEGDQVIVLVQTQQNDAFVESGVRWSDNRQPEKALRDASGNIVVIAFATLYNMPN